MTFESIREPLDDFAIREWIGHFANYRKQISDLMLPLERLRIRILVANRRSSECKTHCCCSSVLEKNA